MRVLGEREQGDDGAEERADHDPEEHPFEVRLEGTSDVRRHSNSSFHGVISVSLSRNKAQIVQEKCVVHVISNESTDRGDDDSPVCPPESCA